MASQLLIYGATGYTGRLIVERAVARGLRPIVAGRNGEAVASLANKYRLEHRAVRADQPKRLRSMAASASVVVNAAGPFALTSAPLIAACVAAGAHYVDISGETAVIEGATRWHTAAERRDVMLMPGAGFDVVPSDCLAAHVARRLPGAATLKLGFAAPASISRGSLRTAVDNWGNGVWVRRAGRLAAITPGSLAHEFDFGAGPRYSLAISLGDVSSAFFSTGIPNIETYLHATPEVWGSVMSARYFGWLVTMPAWKSFAKWQLRWLPEGPSAAERRSSAATIVAEATDRNGRRAHARMRTPEVYSFTARSVVRIAERILAGDWCPGFQTPSRVYGPDFALSFRGVTREDL